MGLTASPPAHVDEKRTTELIGNFEKSLNSEIILVNEYKEELRKDISIPHTVVYEIIPSKYQSISLQLSTLSSPPYTSLPLSAPRKIKYLFTFFLVRGPTQSHHKQNGRNWTYEDERYEKR